MPKRCRPLIGTFVEISADREDAIEAAFEAIAQVHRLMSAHEPDSDVSRINRLAHQRPVEVEDWTARVLERALYWAKQSGGAFDPVRAGKGALARGAIPRHRDQPQPEASHWTWLELQGRSAQLLKPGCIDLGGIAKGFAVDRAIEALRRGGCTHGLVNAGGDMRGFGAHSSPVTVVEPRERRPLAVVDLLNSAMATSGGLPDDQGRLSFEHLGGTNPRWSSVTVVAVTACDADALTKILWAAGDDAVRLLHASGSKALAINHDGDVEAVFELAEEHA